MTRLEIAVRLFESKALEISASHVDKETLQECAKWYIDLAEALIRTNNMLEKSSRCEVVTKEELDRRFPKETLDQ